MAVAVVITPEDERRYNLKPLPDVPFIGVEESLRRNAAYVEQRRFYRELNPLKESK